jgi:tRNA pseudouridine synthase 10
VISRNYFGKHFVPTNIDSEQFQKHIPIPPEIPPTAIQLEKITFTGPTIFVAGRYNKFSRELSQSPWILNGKRMSEGSVQESIVCHVTPYFDASVSSVTFMSSGREDVDVRCLGRGRPFALEIVDATKTTMASSVAADIERKVCQSRVVSIRDLQVVKR